MTADLLTRARSAVTVEEECKVIWDACAALAKHGPRYGEGRPALQRIVAAVNNEDMPRAVLLGVVAALVPEGARYVLNSERGISYRSEKGAHIVLHPLKLPAYMLLLIALLEAGNVEA